MVSRAALAATVVALLGSLGLYVVANGGPRPPTVQVMRASAPVPESPIAIQHPERPPPPEPQAPPPPSAAAEGRARRAVGGSGGSFHRATALPSGPSTVATAVVRSVGIYVAPGDSTPARRLANPQPLGTPLLFLVLGQQGDWLEVLLPIRPNGSAGWIRAEEVRLDRHNFRILIELAAHRLTVFHGDQPVLREPVGLGRGATPTPGGIFYTKELIEPTDARGRYDPGGPYGPYAYSLSGFSEVLTNFGGGPGTIGIHGTNDPGGLGRAVSHGCIRIRNEAITLMARTLPLGVPVEVV